MPAWKEYQEEAADVFRDLGFNAETDVSVDGVRNRHDIDVLATYEHAGLDLTWLIECKQWKSRVKKVQVLSLRTVVEDVGADRGLLIAESGFQKGAIQATHKSNVVVTSLAKLRIEAAAALVQRRLMALPERLSSAQARYWAIPKSYREATGLRPESLASGYSGTIILQLLPGLIVDALAGTLPPQHPFGIPIPVKTKSSAADVAEVLLSDLERRLAQAEVGLPQEIRDLAAADQRARDEYEVSPEDALAVTMAVDLLMGRPSGYSLAQSEAPAKPITHQGENER
ncbi:restriction endonuclease [Herbiconiux sp. CPCC 205716]|uniref:Restriction endonuclease n=1 Tax=Herbiconiux gentiana TaxID=2970912 RepID=A0ABT2GEQ3_9MICO|nr:restriction endonuclease [Herbiconiux gentiana]MCS5714591.1 restriction endonuclease [Herbiconiux gentiana]